MPRYVTIDLFGKVGVGKTTIFELFAGDKFLEQGGNLSYDHRQYYAKCWILPNKWYHSMIFLADPKLEWRWRDINVKFLRVLFQPTNILFIVTDSTETDVANIKKSFNVFPKIKRKLIIFIIANMQDKEDRMSVEEIKKKLGVRHVLGINATDPSYKEELEKYMTEAVLLYFKMLSKRGEALKLLDEEEIGFNAVLKENNTPKGKYAHKVMKVKKKNREIEQTIIQEEQEKRKKRLKVVEEHKKKLLEIAQTQDDDQNEERNYIEDEKKEERELIIKKHKERLKSIKKQRKGKNE